MAGFPIVNTNGAGQRFGGGGGTVIEREVGNGKTDEFRNQGLEFPHRLEHALADFGLIGCVGCSQLSNVADWRYYRRGYEVRHTIAEKASADTVLRCNLGELLLKFFASLGSDHDLVKSGRKRLTNLLFV